METLHRIAPGPKKDLAAAGPRTGRGLKASGAAPGFFSSLPLAPCFAVNPILAVLSAKDPQRGGQGSQSTRKISKGGISVPVLRRERQNSLCTQSFSDGELVKWFGKGKKKKYTFVVAAVGKLFQCQTETQFLSKSELKFCF